MIDIVGWTTPNVAAVVVLAAVTLQRLAELRYSRRNEARLRSKGAVEHAPGHYPAIVLLHAAWLVGLWVLAVGIRPHLGWLALFVVLQLLRVWVLATLGRRWTTRILVLPGETLVSAGPYRLLPHPNYAVVVAEIFVLPMVFGLTLYGVVFSVLNAAVLWVRISAESAALGSARRSS
jgi:methyltransferase